MDRRTYLGRCLALAAATVPAGCTDQTLEDTEEPPPWVDARFDDAAIDLPVTQIYDVTEAAIERAAGETFEDPEAFETYLRENGLGVERLEEIEEAGETILELEHVVEDVIAHTVGLVAGGYAALVRGGYDGDELRASVLDSAGQQFGEYEIVTDRAMAYVDGETSAAVYGGEALHTLETAR